MMTALSAAGTLGMKRCSPKMRSSAPMPTTLALMFQSPMLVTAAQSFSAALPSLISTPNSLPNWPTMIWMDMPKMKPAMTALEMKFATQPILARPNTR